MDEARVRALAGAPEGIVVPAPGTAMAAVETTRPAPYGAITTYRAINALWNAVMVFQAWNDARTRALVDSATVRRARQLADTGLKDYKAVARGYVTFLAQVGETGSQRLVGPAGIGQVVGGFRLAQPAVRV